jgi:hypothetical protein
VFFYLLVVPLSYKFEGRFKSTYPPMNLEFWPLEVAKTSLLTTKPFFDLQLNWVVMQVNFKKKI